MTHRKHHKAIGFLATLIVLLAAAGCSGDANVTGPPEPEPEVCTDTFERKAFAHHVIGFYPAWKHDVLPVSQIRWDKLTRVIYAFAIPQSTGALDLSDLTQVDALVTAAHAQGVEVFLSVGGGAGSGNFPVLAADAGTRRTFVLGVRDYLAAHCLDGVDIDWESWTKDSNNVPVASEKANLVALLEELRNALEPAGLKISIDVFAANWFGQHYDDAVHPLVDYVHVMGYDFSGPWSAPGPHSSFEQVIGSGSGASATGLAYWTRYRNWPKAKLLLGLPFYGRDFDNNGGAGIAYRDIVALYPQAPEADRVANIYYNGVQTITAKTRYVVDNGYPGVMIWELAHDTRDAPTSLLHAVDRVVNP